MLLRKRNDFDLFDDFFGDMFNNFAGNMVEPQLMRTDIQEKDGQYLLDIELPGYEKKDVQAELKDGYLTISAKKDQSIESKDEKSHFVRKERYTGSMKRSFYVGEDVKEEDIQAGFKDGVLKVIVKKEAPKAIEDSKKFIPIL